MTPYRPIPSHLLPRKRKPLPWWRRLVLGWKARRWHKAMVERAERRHTERLMNEASMSMGFSTIVDAFLMPKGQPDGHYAAPPQERCSCGAPKRLPLPEPSARIMK